MDRRCLWCDHRLELVDGAWRVLAAWSDDDKATHCADSPTDLHEPMTEATARR